MRPRKCSNCSAPLPPNRNVCQYCMTQHEEKTSNPFTIIAIISAILFISGFGVLAASFYKLEPESVDVAPTNTEISAKDVIQFISDKENPRNELEVQFQNRFLGQSVEGEGTIFYRRLSEKNKSVILVRTDSGKPSYYFRLLFHPDRNDFLRDLDKNRLYKFKAKILGWASGYTVEVGQVEISPIDDPPIQSFKNPTSGEIQKILEQWKENQPMKVENLYWFSKIDWIETEFLDNFYKKYLAGNRIEGKSMIITTKKEQLNQGMINAVNRYKGGSILLTFYVIPEDQKLIQSLDRNSEVDFKGIVSTKQSLLKLNIDEVNLEASPK